MRTPVRRLAMLATALVASVATLMAGYAAPAQAEAPAMVVIEPGHLNRDHTVPFRLDNLAPGDSRTATVAVRNDAARLVHIRYGGATFTDDTLSEHLWISVRHNGVELTRGRAGSPRVHGASFEVGPGTTSTLEIELTMHRGEDNAAQGTSMLVDFEFAVQGGVAPIATGVAPDGTPLSAGGDSTAQTLPPTGESLGIFHLLVWATLGTFAAALLTLLLVALRTRDDGVRR